MEFLSENESSDNKRYWHCPINGKILSMRLKSENIITIRFNNTNNKIVLYANAECCSVSWFQLHDVHTVFGKQIDCIYDTGQLTDLPKSKNKGYDKNHLIVIQFTDNGKYQFYMRNSSNGYYDAYLNINVV